MSVKDFPRDKASEAASCRRAQVNTVRGGADVAITHLSVDKKIALSVVSGKKLGYFEEQSVKFQACCTVASALCKTFRLSWLNLQLCLPT